MGKLLSKMKIFHLVLLILSGLLMLSALPFKTQYSNIYVNVSTTIEEATGEDTNISLEQSQDLLFNFFKVNTCEGFVDNNGQEFVHDFDVYKVQVYEFENNLNSLNTLILWFGIVSLIGVAFLYIFSNNSRRIYYTSNVFVYAVFTGAMVVLFVITLIKSFSVMSDFVKDSNLYNYVAVLQSDERLAAYKHGIETIDGVAPSLDYMKSCFSCDVATFIGYDIFFVVYIAYVIFVFVLTLAKYKATAERRAELAKVVTVND